MSQRMNRRRGAWRIRFGVAGQRRRNRRPWRGWRLAADEGAVTAEFAVVLPAVILVTVVLIALARTVTVSMSCQDAAAVAVREIVVAGDESDPVGAAQAVAGADSSVSVTYGSEAVSVTVSCPVIPDPLGVLPTVVTAEATGVAQ